MKSLKILFWAVLGVILISSSVIAQEKSDEEFVYALEIKGEVTFRPTQKDAPKRVVRRMEAIPVGVTLEIAEGASVSLTCPGCGMVTRTHGESPYTVRMEEFKREKTSMGETLKRFKAALKSMVFPGSKIGPKAHLFSRGSEAPCDHSWPETGEIILPIGSDITFVWGSTGGLTLEIRELPGKEPVFLERLSSDELRIPFERFTPGKSYECTLSEDEIGRKCSTTFSVATNEDSSKIMDILKDLASLLPAQADKDTRCGLQAGYLDSQGFRYNAWQWMDSCL